MPKNILPPQAWQILQPSWFSSFISLTLAIVISLSAVITAEIKYSSFAQDIFAVHNAASAKFSSSYQTIAGNLGRYQIINDLVVLLFWMGIGLVAYFFLSRLIKGLSAAYKVEQELHYVNSKPRKVLRESGLHLLLRLIGLLLWWIVLQLLFNQLLPYDLASSSAIVKQFTVINSLWLVLATFLLVVNFSLQAACLRLMVLRRRLFTSNEVQ